MMSSSLQCPIVRDNTPGNIKDKYFQNSVFLVVKEAGSLAFYDVMIKLENKKNVH